MKMDKSKCKYWKFIKGKYGCHNDFNGCESTIKEKQCPNWCKGYFD